MLSNNHAAASSYSSGPARGYTPHSFSRALPSSGWIGGDAMYAVAGEDGTDVFGAFHPPSASDLLKKFYVGDVDSSIPLKDVAAIKKRNEALFRDLRAKAIKMGLFKSR